MNDGEQTSFRRPARRSPQPSAAMTLKPGRLAPSDSLQTSIFRHNFHERSCVLALSSKPNEITCVHASSRHSDASTEIRRSRSAALSPLGVSVARCASRNGSKNAGCASSTFPPNIVAQIVRRRILPPIMAPNAAANSSLPSACSSSQQHAQPQSDDAFSAGRPVLDTPEQQMYSRDANGGFAVSETAIDRHRFRRCVHRVESPVG